MSDPSTPATPTAAEQLGATQATLTIDGQQYTIPALSVPPHVLADEVDQHLAAIQLHPMDALARSLTHLRAIKRADLADVVADAALRAVRQESIRKPDPEGVARWIQSADGLIWLAWRSLKQQHPTLTLDKVRDAMLAQQRQEAGPASPASPNGTAAVSTTN